MAKWYEEEGDGRPSEDEIAALNERMQLERAVHGEESNEQLAERLLREAAPGAAREIVSLSTSRHVPERVRLQASQYILERVCGKVGDDGTKGKAPWDEVFGATSIEAPAEL